MTPETIAALFGVIGGGLGTAIVNAIANRGKARAESGAVTSAEYREWTQEFRAEVLAVRERHAADVRGLKTMIDALRADADALRSDAVLLRAHVAKLEEDKARLERERAELTRELAAAMDRIEALERAALDAGQLDESNYGTKEYDE